MIIFSIIIPLYNKKSLVKKTINSVLSQTYQDFEIIVVDDGSKDNSAEYVKEYTDVRIKYYYKDNGGVSSARNYGIEKAQGEWIVLLDADDEMLEGTLMAFSDSISMCPNARMHVSRQDNKYEGNGLLQKFVIKLFGRCHQTRIPLFVHWLRLFFPCPGTVCILKDHIIERGLFKTYISFYEDIEFMIRQMKNTIVGYTYHYSLKYNQAESGLSGSSHPIEKEMAYYIPEYVETSSFWHKALLYENLEAEIYWWQLHGNEENVKFYQDMQMKYFGSVYKILHWIRQKMIRRGII